MSTPASTGGVVRSTVAPDALRPTVVAGVMRIDPHRVRLRLVPGSREPRPGILSEGTVPVRDRSRLLAAFNAGFKMRQSAGGWFSEGVTAVPLVAGAASLVLRDDGSAQVGLWGRDASMDSHVVAVRQNLGLLVDGGAPTAAVGTTDYEGVWGHTIHRLVHVPRSGIGITADGSLVYVAGNDLYVAELAQALVDAGAVRAMELDINPQFVAAYTFVPGPLGPMGQDLVPGLRDGPEHYFRPQERDFVEVLST